MEEATMDDETRDELEEREEDVEGHALKKADAGGEDEDEGRQALFLK
jgi:hypothetical protein